MSKYTDSSPQRKSQQNHFNQTLSQNVLPAVRETIMSAAREIAADRNTEPDIFDVDAAADDIIRSVLAYLFQAQIEESDRFIVHPCQLNDEYIQAWFGVGS